MSTDPTYISAMEHFESMPHEQIYTRAQQIDSKRHSRRVDDLAGDRRYSHQLDAADQIRRRPGDQRNRLDRNRRRCRRREHPQLRRLHRRTRCGDGRSRRPPRWCRRGRRSREAGRCRAGRVGSDRGDRPSARVRAGDRRADGGRGAAPGSGAGDEHDLQAGVFACRNGCSSVAHRARGAGSAVGSRGLALAGQRVDAEPWHESLGATSQFAGIAAGPGIH